MKQRLIAAIFLLATVAGHGKPMTGAVSSWEGRFVLSDKKIVIRTPGKPDLRMWLYRLPGGSEGTAVGFSNEHGDMILSPAPSEKGVQPVYIRHLVSFAEDGNVELLVLYRVQGNGGLLLVEKYVYDGKHIRLSCKSLYGGRHDPVRILQIYAITPEWVMAHFPGWDPTPEDVHRMSIGYVAWVSCGVCPNRRRDLPPVRERRDDYPCVNVHMACRMDRRNCELFGR